MQNKNDGNKNKMILGDLNCPVNKMDGDGKIKNKDFIDSVSIKLCQSSLWIMEWTWGSMEKGEARLSWVHLLQ